MFTKDMLGREVVTKVEEKAQESDGEDIEIFCEICEEDLTYVNFNPVQAGRDRQAVACTQCDSSHIHIRCMNWT